MATSNIEVVEIGIPGPPGAGVSSAEKNSYFQKTGGTITGQTIFDLDGTPAIQIRKADDTSLVFVDTVNSRFRLVNGMDIQGYSDNMSTETWSIDGATGAAQFDGDVTTGGNIVGDKLWWGIEIDGGGSAITTGLKRRIKIPYDCTLVADSVDGHFWQIGLDQSGSIGLDLWMDSYSNYPPTNADRISGTVGSQNPRVSAATKGGSGTTTGWTLNLVGGRYLFVNVDSVSTATFCVLGLHIIRT
jgi:hypothetical protein